MDVPRTQPDALKELPPLLRERAAVEAAPLDCDPAHEGPVLWRALVRKHHLHSAMLHLVKEESVEPDLTLNQD